MGFLKKLLAVLLTFINLIAFKIYENEILEDSLLNNIAILIVEGFQFRWLNIKTTHAVWGEQTLNGTVQTVRIGVSVQHFFERFRSRFAHPSMPYFNLKLVLGDFKINESL